MARIATIKILLELAASHGLHVEKQFFLNEELEEEICMKQLSGFVVPEEDNKMCRLIKSLYGLKQTPKQWHENFDTILISARFKVDETDKCIIMVEVNALYLVCMLMIYLYLRPTICLAAWALCFFNSLRVH